MGLRGCAAKGFLLENHCRMGCCDRSRPLPRIADRQRWHYRLQRTARILVVATCSVAVYRRPLALLVATDGSDFSRCNVSPTAGTTGCNGRLGF